MAVEVPVPWSVFWPRLRAAISSRKRITNWSRDGLVRDGDFNVIAQGDYIYAELDGGSSRSIYFAEIQVVYQVWSQYLAGSVRRGKISHDMGVYNGKYIISILHQFQHLM